MFNIATLESKHRGTELGSVKIRFMIILLFGPVVTSNVFDLEKCLSRSTPRQYDTQFSSR
jgi:hypothetical protein